MENLKMMCFGLVFDMIKTNPLCTSQHGKILQNPQILNMTMDMAEREYQII